MLSMENRQEAEHLESIDAWGTVAQSSIPGEQEKTPVTEAVLSKGSFLSTELSRALSDRTIA